MSVNDSREVEISSIVQMLGSRAMVERVVDQLGVATINGRWQSPESNQAAAPTSPSLAQRDPRYEQAVTKVEKSIAISAPEKSTVISVECRAKSPDLAQNIVSTLMDSYLVEHLRIHRTEGSHKFFLEQSELLKDDLANASRKLRDAKNELGVNSIAGKRQTIQSQIVAIESHIINTETELSGARAKIESLSSTIADMSEQLVIENVTGFPNVGADNMRDQFYQLQIRERELRSKYTDAHPQVQAMRYQIEQAQEILNARKSTRDRSTTAINPSRQRLKMELLTEQSNVESLVARVTTLQQQHASTHEDLRSLNHSELRIAELQRNLDLTEASYRTYAEKLEQTRIDEALQVQRISNVNVVQSANYISKPVSPMKGLIFALGLIIASMGSYGVAMAAEFCDRSLKTRDEVEQRLGLPVLRFSTAFGVSPRMRFDLLVSDFTLAAVRERKLVVYGEQFWRPFVHIQDIATAASLMLDADPHLVSGEVFNVGSNDCNMQKASLAKSVQQRVPDTQLDFVHRDHDPRSYRVGFSKIQTRLGFRASWSVEQRIDEVHAALKADIWKDPSDAKYYN